MAPFPIHDIGLARGEADGVACHDVLFGGVVIARDGQFKMAFSLAGKAPPDA
jgi:hypothetical protein